MNNKLQKLIPLLGLAAIIATTPTFAYDDDHHDAHSAQHAVPPAVHPPGEDNLTFFISAAYTYWVPYQDGMFFARQTNPGTTDLNSPGTFYTPRMNGCSGFKVGIAANTDHDGWNAAIGYTWFYNSPSMHATSFRDAGPVRGTFQGTQTQAGDVYDSAESRFANQFNRIDGVVDRAFYAGHYLALRPWMGLLGAWEEQNFDFNVVAITTTGDETPEEYRNRQNWWGIGPYAGADATFYFTNELGLFLSSGVSLLLATHDIRQYEAVLDNAGAVDNYDFFYTRTSYNVEPMIENSLGLRWDSFWTDWALRVEVAWEMQTYFSHNGFVSPQLTALGFGETYSMQGLTAGMRVNF